MTKLVFLKLGGSLITDKNRPYTPRQDKLNELAGEIALALQEQPDVQLILGHGSGSFGHTAAREYHTRDGFLPNADTPAGARAHYWQGFTRVWYQAATLNRFVMDALFQAGIPALALAPVAALTARAGKVASWDLAPLQSALAAGITPVIYGDVIFDEQRAGTILSTEDLFEHLALQLKPSRILLAGLEGAVWADFPQRQRRVEKITPASFAQIQHSVGASQSADVTGGMESKVSQMLSLVQVIPGLQTQIFSGETPGNTRRVLFGENLGTLLASE